MKFCEFFIGKRRVDLTFDTVASDYVERAEADVVDAVFAVHHRRNRKRGVRIGKYRLYDMAYGGRYGIERRALTRNYSRARFADVFFDFGYIDFRG